MFDKFKQAKKLKELKNNLSKEKEACEKEGVKVVVNGQMKVESIEINPEVDEEIVEKLIKDCTNEALQSIQKRAAKMMQSQGGF